MLLEAEQHVVQITSSQSLHEQSSIKTRIVGYCAGSTECLVYKIHKTKKIFF